MLLNCVLEETLESPLDCKEIKPINSKGNQLQVLTGRTDPEAESPIIWLSHEKRRLPGKFSDVGKVKARGEGDDRGRDGWTVSLKLPT